MKKTLSSILLASSFLTGCADTKSTYNSVNVSTSLKNNDDSTGIYEISELGETISGARDIKRHLVQDSRYGLIHIRDFHYEKNLSDKGLAEVLAIQKDVYSILDYLQNNLGVNKIYGEGRLMERDGPMAGPMNLPPDKREETLLFDGADMLFFFEGRAGIRPGDKKELWEKAIEKLNALIRENEESKYADPLKFDIEKSKKIVKEFRDAVYKPREDYLLETVSSYDDHLAVTVFGGSHDWTDNIKEWNRKHPHEKFSLIVITPQSYPKD